MEKVTIAYQKIRYAMVFRIVEMAKTKRFAQNTGKYESNQ